MIAMALDAQALNPDKAASPERYSPCKRFALVLSGNRYPLFPNMLQPALISSRSGYCP